MLFIFLFSRFFCVVFVIVFMGEGKVGFYYSSCYLRVREIRG